jgi:hypothetical protein
MEKALEKMETGGDDRQVVEKALIPWRVMTAVG